MLMDSWQYRAFVCIIVYLRVIFKRGGECIVINVGVNYGDLLCVGLAKKDSQGRKYYTMKCTKCGREKEMLISTIRLKKRNNTQSLWARLKNHKQSVLF